MSNPKPTDCVCHETSSRNCPYHQWLENGQLNKENDVSEKESEAVKDIYLNVKSMLEFVWICEDKICNTINRTMYDSWRFYDGKQDCSRCEKAYRVKEPWS